MDRTQVAADAGRGGGVLGRGGSRSGGGCRSGVTRGGGATAATAVATAAIARIAARLAALVAEDRVQQARTALLLAAAIARIAALRFFALRRFTLGRFAARTATGVAARVAGEQATQASEQVATAAAIAAIARIAALGRFAAGRLAALRLAAFRLAALGSAALGCVASTFRFTTTATAAAEHRVQEFKRVTLAAQAQNDDDRTGNLGEFHRATSPRRGEPSQTGRIRRLKRPFAPGQSEEDPVDLVGQGSILNKLPKTDREPNRREPTMRTGGSGTGGVLKVRHLVAGRDNPCPDSIHPTPN